MIVIMIKIQDRGTALLLLLVNPHILQHHAFQLSSAKKTLCLALCCWLCSTRCTGIQINNYFKRTSAIKVANMKITDNFHYG